MCCRVVRSCGAERARFCADASGHADATLAAAGSPRRWSPVQRGACGKRSAIRCAVRAVDQDRASDHQRFCAAFTATSQAERDPAPSRAGACTCARAAVALPDRRSQRGWGNARRAANGQPDGHFRREPQLSPGGGACRDPGSGARSCRRPALGLGQGQSVLPARLQSRPRHRHGDLLGRRADQFAHQRAWPRLHRSQFSYPRNDQRIGGPQGAVLGGRRRFRQRRRVEYLAAG